jgi:predicted Zn-dependent peptidase
MDHLESVALGVWVKSGSRDETAQEHGIAHLLEHMAFKGTHKRTARQIAEEIENVGGEVNAATSTETTAYYARVLKDNVPLAIDILHDILTNSVFDEGELTREKHVILQEIGAANDTPDDVVYDRFTEAAFATRPSAGRSSARPKPSRHSRRNRSVPISRATTPVTVSSWWPQALWITTPSSS